MPNRVLRDWTASDKIDQLSEGAEIFFTRLIMKADDMGRYYASPKMLKSTLFPLRDVKESQVKGWIKECHKVGIIQSYEVDDKEYIHIPHFDQRLRIMKSKFPDPPCQTNDGQVTDMGRRETKRNETESETESESATAQVWPVFEDFWLLYGKKVDRPKCEKKWAKIPQVAREKIMIHVEEYVKVTPDIQYRKNPATYLNNESWNNEIIKNGNTAKQITRDDRVRFINAKYGTEGTSQG